MTAAEYRAALQLLESASTALQAAKTTPQKHVLRRWRRLTLEFDLLRARVGQPQARYGRN